MSVLPTKRQAPYKELWQCSILLHGQPKIGKTEFASKFPNPCFAATEEGQGFIDVYEPVPIFDTIEKKEIGPGQVKLKFIGMSGWEKFNFLIHELENEKHEFQTLVIDTVDNLWLRCVNWHCVHHEVEYETDGALGWGKGSSLISRDFTEVLTRACRLPMGVIFISHSVEKDYTTPQGKKKTRVVTTLPPRAMQTVNSMVDMIFYITFEGDQRVIKTKAGVNYDAGSRVKGLAETIPLSYDKLIAAYSIAVNGDKNTVKGLITRIEKGEFTLAQAKIDNFEVEKRKLASRKKHAGNEDLKKCELSGLEAYLQHLQVKYEKEKKSASK